MKKDVPVPVRLVIDVDPYQVQVLIDNIVEVECTIPSRRCLKEAIYRGGGCIEVEDIFNCHLHKYALSDT